MFGNVDQPYLITCTLISYFFYIHHFFQITYFVYRFRFRFIYAWLLIQIRSKFLSHTLKKIFHHYMFLPPLSNLFQIRMNNYPSFSDVSSFESFPPTANQCDVPSAYCIRSFFCKRNSAGMCTSGNLGPCSY